MMAGGGGGGGGGGENILCILITNGTFEGINVHLFSTQYIRIHNAGGRKECCALYISLYYNSFCVCK